MQRRWLASIRSPRNLKGLNLTSFVSPLLLRLHPDTLQREAPELAQENEGALKQLNIFLELAAFGCNNDAFNARKQLLGHVANRYDILDEPLHFPLTFHVPLNDYKAQVPVGRFVAVKYTIVVPSRLVQRTLSNVARSISAREDPYSALSAPFAREWQRITKRILQDLFEVAQVPFVVGEGETMKTTALAMWLAEDDSAVEQGDRDRICAGQQNRAKKREHEQFNKIFHKMLTHEREIVQETTTGLEDVPTSQHAVLTTLLHSRLLLPKFHDPHMKMSAFHWIANFLLVNFVELRLHSLVWNKITMLLTDDVQVKDPQVAWDEEYPELGMGILIPLGMNVDILIDFMYEKIEDLECALQATTTNAGAASGKQSRQSRDKKNQKRKQKQQKHFYQDEINAIFRPKQ
ncbi:hypothetical protein CCR75_004084 [Bremia lactucae]|uniref:DUF4460 domain-containing protein n=1 Tax=Bremia lactucae TaxID=4779 RepID=A0A976IK53_BRELC|nr:hypothetical protein CCR75_004084 [Bremia lactucae]